MLSLKNLFTLPFLSVPGFVPTLPPIHPPMWINQVSGASRALSVRWA